jgi:hypothetical protein
MGRKKEEGRRKKEEGRGKRGIIAILIYGSAGILPAAG